MTFLMAFGDGALLAALTIDLVGSALERGHFDQLIVGCVNGRTLFAFGYPDALSGPVGMRQQGMGFVHISRMWTSIMLSPGVGAIFGNLFSILP